MRVKSNANTTVERKNEKLLGIEEMASGKRRWAGIDLLVQFKTQVVSFVVPDLELRLSSYTGLSEVHNSGIHNCRHLRMKHRKIPQH